MALVWILLPITCRDDSSLRSDSERHFLKGFAGYQDQSRALGKRGFCIDTLYIFAKIRKQLTLLVFQGITCFPAGLNVWIFHLINNSN